LSSSTSHASSPPYPSSTPASSVRERGWGSGEVGRGEEGRGGGGVGAYLASSRDVSLEVCNSK